MSLLNYFVISPLKESQREANPLLYNQFLLSFERVKGSGESKRGEPSEYAQRESKRGEVPLKKQIPLPLIKGKGIKGIGLHDKNLCHFLEIASALYASQ